MNGTMELLAPAGDEAALRAAVCAGADAVYLGYARFGARAAAANFGGEALQKAVAYAHLYGVRVYVTLNTLVKQGELQGVFEALSAVAASGADAAIVQDMGVLRLAREAFPGLLLHASTQMGIHSAAGARMALGRGVARAVLAREGTLAQAAAIAQTGIEVEAFVHGALCASVSGQCLMSSMAGGRSGNRGRCAQPCRQAVAFGGESAAFLSMKDLCLRDHLPELAAAGVKALKIEGRLKRPEYVAVVTARYRAALDALARGAFRPADAREKAELMQIFQRGGFTKGHLLGAEDAALCATRRVGHGGVRLGRVARARDGFATVELAAPLHDGDSLRVESGADDVELRYAGPEQALLATLRLRPGLAVRAGDAVYRTADALQLAAAQALAEPPISVWLTAAVRAGEPLRLSATDGRATVTAEGEAAQTPRTRPMTGEDVARQLAKLGDTPFTLAAEPMVDTDGAFAPVSALNALRRDALSRLAQARISAFEAARPGGATARARFAGYEAYTAAGTPLEAAQAAWPHDTASAAHAADGSLFDAEPAAPFAIAAATAPAALQPRRAALPKPFCNTLAVRFTDASLGQDLQAAGANLLLYAPGDLRPEPLARALAALPDGAWLQLPPQLSDAVFDGIAALLAAESARLGGVALGSVGQLGFPIGLPVALGEGVPLLNREAARELLGGQVAFFTHWPELSRAELTELGLTGFAALMPVYGRERVMLLNHCPERVRLGLTHGRAACDLCGAEHRACAQADPALTDRLGYRFPLTRTRMPEGCVLEVHNALPTDLSRQLPAISALNAGLLLRFTTESPAEQAAVTARYAALIRGYAAATPDTPATAGHFLRGVE